jgi:hypothetical protein
VISHIRAFDIAAYPHGGFLKNHWHEVEALGVALLERKTLTGAADHSGNESAICNPPQYSGCTYSRSSPSETAKPLFIGSIPIAASKLH